MKLLAEQVVGDSLIEWLTLSTLVGMALGFWNKHNCHQHRCLRLSWHPDASGHPVCKVHHPDHPARGWFRK